MFGYSIKRRNDDFKVYETPFLDKAHDEVAREHHYYLLTKSGHSTFSAVDQISDYFCLDKTNVRYFGLKDEEAITEQHISISSKLSVEHVKAFNCGHYHDRDDFLKLIYLSAGSSEIKIGQSAGNCFTILLRNLADDMVDRLLVILERKHRYFLNYFGPQRFGIPGEKKLTHLIGEQVLKGNYSQALTYLIESNSPDAKIARTYKGSPESFFESLDSRVVHFFHNAYLSSLWNSQLNEIVSRSNYPFTEQLLENLKYNYIDDDNDLLRSLADNSLIEAQSQYLENRLINRPAFTHMRITFDQPVMDQEVCKGTWAISLRFFLPSGCYATMAIDQLVHYARNIKV